MDFSTMVKVYLLAAGTIGIPVLKALAQSDKLQLCGVGTQPDRPAGRGRKLLPTPVGKAADELNIPCERIPNVNDPEYIARLKELSPDILLVISFGQLLKEEILNVPNVDCVNIHASLLPKYRGASPIMQSILNLDEATGVCFMQMERTLDSGPVYASIKRPLDGTEYAEPLEYELGELAAQNCDNVLTKIANKEITPVIQDKDLVTVCGKIKKSAGVINWEDTAAKVCAKIRAFSNWPEAKMYYSCNDSSPIACSILAARVVNLDIKLEAPGTPVALSKKTLAIACSDGYIELLKVAPAGSKLQDIAAFRNGLRGILPKIYTGKELEAITMELSNK
jgi:methionyl-tRNA formyltransferase